jgi:hypothetical protein
MTDVFVMAAGDSAEMWCYDNPGGDGLSYVYSSSITAILINNTTNNSGIGGGTMKTHPPRIGHPGKAPAAK